MSFIKSWASSRASGRIRACSTCFRPRWRRLAIHFCRTGRASGGIGARSERQRMPKQSKAELTTPDLVLLSLLAEQPMHGYQANAELERRQVRDWAAISRPQVYYSLEKLARAELIAPARDRVGSGGPDRMVYRTTAKG